MVRGPVAGHGIKIRKKIMVLLFRPITHSAFEKSFLTFRFTTKTSIRPTAKKNSISPFGNHIYS